MQLASLLAIKFRLKAAFVINASPEYPNLFGVVCPGSLPSKPLAPFFVVDNDSRSIRLANVPFTHIIPLAFAISSFCERVFPADVIPVVNVERHWNEFFEQLRAALQRAQPTISGRTAAASL